MKEARGALRALLAAGVAVVMATAASAATAEPNTYGLVKKDIGKAPEPGVGPSGTSSGVITESLFSVHYSAHPPAHGEFQVDITFTKPRPVLRPGEIIELGCHATASYSGNDMGYIGAGGKWLAEGNVEVLETTNAYAGWSGQDGKFYPSGDCKLRIKIPAGGGIIRLISAPGGYAWGTGGIWNPCIYTYQWNAPPIETDATSPPAVSEGDQTKPEDQKTTLSAIDAREFVAADIHFPLVVAEGDLRTGTLANLGREVAGVAADGASLLLLRAATARPGTATFFKAMAGGGLHPLIGDPFSSPGANSLEVRTRPVIIDGRERHMAFALYRPPDSFGPGNSKPVVQLEVRVAIDPVSGVASPSAPGPVSTIELPIVPAPIVLVHGTYDTPKMCWQTHEEIDDAPESMERHLRRAGYGDVFAVDWEATNGMGDPSSFVDNETTVWRNAGGIRDALAAMRARGIAATRADLICHSQGGVISRVYARGHSLMTALAADHPHYRDPDACARQGCWYHRADNHARGDIHRLITISTTHRGSDACLLFKGLDRFYAERVATDPTAEAVAKSLVVDLFRMVVDRTMSGITSQGFLNQMPGSLELRGIGPTRIPSHAIACVADDATMKSARPDPSGLTKGMGNYYGKLFTIYTAVPTDVIAFALEQIAPPGDAQRFRELAEQFAKSLILDMTEVNTFQPRPPSLECATSVECRDRMIFHLRRAIFQHDENDCTVALNSSFAGIGEPYRTRIPGVLHGYAPRYVAVQRRVIELLADQGALFDPDGFPAAYHDGAGPGPTTPRRRDPVVSTDGGSRVLDVGAAVSQPAVGLRSRAPATGAAGFAGSWDTDMGRIVLTVDGNTVRGTYQQGQGALTGSLSAGNVAFTYRLGAESGTGELTLAADGASFQGFYLMPLEDGSALRVALQGFRVGD